MRNGFLSPFPGARGGCSFNPGNPAYIDGPMHLLGVFLVPTIVTGGRATAGATGGIDSNSRVIDMSDTIHLLDPNMAPLTAITMKLRKAHAINPKVEWLEDEYLPVTDTLNGAIANGGITTIVMDNGEYFRDGDVLKNLNTGEHVLVTAVSGNNLTVVRGVGDTAAGAMSDADTMLIIGNANAEGATSRTVKTTQKTPAYNYTQIFRWPYSATGTLMASEIYGGNDLNYQRRKAGLEHRINMERAYLFGERKEVTSGATALRYADGIINRIATNTTSTANVTANAFEDFLTRGFRYGPARKMFFCSRLFVNILNRIARTGFIQTIPTTKSFPLALTEYVSGHGKCYIVTHNLLEGDIGATHQYQGFGLLLDMDSLFHRYLQGRDTRVKTNIQAPDEDSQKDEYLTESCLMAIQERNHSLWDTANAAA